MDFVSKTHEALSPRTSYSSPPSFHHYSSNEPGFPIIAIAVIGILATAFVLVTYYILVIKCCLNIHSSNSINNNNTNHHQDQSLLIITSSEDRNHRGLDDSVIRSIPVYRYRRNDTKNALKDDNNSKECAVCLAEFQDDEKLRVIPICGHLFHIDCIDVWLQGNANCPLCRTSVPNAIRLVERIIAPSPSPVGYYDDDNSRLLDHQNRVERPNKIGKGASMGDECIEIGRDKDERLWVDQPIRRSFSMDSSADRKMFMAIQEAVRQVRSVSNSNSNSNNNGNGNNVEASCSSGNRSVTRKSFFSFGSSRGSSAVLPVYLDEP